MKTLLCLPKTEGQNQDNLSANFQIQKEMEFEKLSKRHQVQRQYLEICAIEHIEMIFHDRIFT